MWVSGLILVYILKASTCWPCKRARSSSSPRYFSDFIIINRPNSKPFHPFYEASRHVILVCEPSTSLLVAPVEVLVTDCILSCKVDCMSLIGGCQFTGMCPGCSKDPAFLFKGEASRKEDLSVPQVSYQYIVSLVNSSTNRLGSSEKCANFSWQVVRSTIGKGM